MKRISTLALATLAAAGLLLTGCGKKGAPGISLQNVGSDTMVNLAQAWAEAYHDVVSRFLGEDKPLRFVDYVKPGLLKRLFGGK